MTTGDEFSESAKAVQEVAKTSNTALQIVKDFGGFISRIIGEPVDEAVGMLTDKLRYSRWERRQRIMERAKQFIEEKNIKDDLRPVPPKIALPIIENASLEDDDELQDLWAYLLASAVDPNFNGSLRTAFIDIIKQLEVNDVHILNFIYNYYEERNEPYKHKTRRTSGSKVKIRNIDGNKLPVSMRIIIKELGIDEDSYEESIDNLIRVRCIASFISEESVDVPFDNSGSVAYDMTTLARFSSSKAEKIKFNITHRYNSVCITPLGVSFAKACMPI